MFILRKNFIFLGWIVLSFFLLLYSFTQIDLNLTFSQFSIWQIIQKSFQHIGYFQRPLSTWLYIGILVLSFAMYSLTVYTIKKEVIDRKDLWKIIFIVSGILLFSYNAFSYDLFNYIFDARIITHYGENPYLHKPQDFISDPMLNFMRSIHRPYPYGPVWLVLTSPLTFLGLEFFLLTFYFFKLLMVGGFLLACYFIEKILNSIASKTSLWGLAIFALNPLVLIESLVSAHNDIVMMAFALGALYFVLKEKTIIGYLLLGLSVGIKFATVILLPLFLYITIMKARKKEVDFNQLFFVIFLVMVASVVIVSVMSGVNKNPEIQPWYLLLVLPFVAFIPNRHYFVVLSFVFSFFLLMSYIPYISAGEWPKNIVEEKTNSLILGIIGGTLGYLFSFKGIYSSLRNIFSRK